MDEDTKVSIGSAENRGNPNIPQRWFDENRQLFGGETTISEIKAERCPHQGYLFRTPQNEVECSRCHAGWMFPLSVRIVDGKILSEPQI